MGLFTQVRKEERTQLYHYDNGDLEFVKRPLVGGSPTQLDKAGNPRRSWIDYYQCLYPFDGFQGISADAVQLAYGRHYHMEVHDILSDDIRPPESDKLNDPYITAIAEARAVEITKTANPHSSYDRLILFLGIGLVLEFVIWGIAYAVRS